MNTKNTEQVGEQQGDALQTVPYDIAKALIESAYTSGTHGVGFGVQSMALKDAILKGTPIPSDTAATRRFIAERTPQPEHRQDVLDGDFDGTAWFSHVQAALAATGKQQVGEAEWVRDIHDVEQGLIQRPVAPHAANNAPSPTIRMQVGEVQGENRSPNEMAEQQAIADFLKERDEALGCPDATDAERAESARLIAALAARQPGAQEAVAEAWIVVKQHAWDHGDGDRPTLAYLWPSEFECRVYPTFGAASEFIKAGNWPLGFVAMQIQAPPAQGIDLGPVAQEASDPSTQIHIGTNAATGGQLWHSDGKGGLWCGNTYHRTPQQLWNECQSVLSDLRNLADDQRDAAPEVKP